MNTTFKIYDYYVFLIFLIGTNSNVRGSAKQSQGRIEEAGGYGQIIASWNKNNSGTVHEKRKGTDLMI